MSTAGDWSRDPLGDADRLRARGAVPWGRTEETGEEWPPLRAALPDNTPERDSYDRDSDDEDPETTSYISSLRDRQSPDGEWYRASSEPPREYETRAARRRAESYPADDYRDGVEYDQGSGYGQVERYGQSQQYGQAQQYGQVQPEPYGQQAQPRTYDQGQTYNTAQTYGVPAGYEAPQAYQPSAYQAPPPAYEPPPAYDPPAYDPPVTQRYQGAADTSGWLPPAQPTTYRKVAPRAADEYDSTYGTGAHHTLDYDIDGRPIAYRALPSGSSGDISRDDGTRDDGAYGATAYGSTTYGATTYGGTPPQSTTYGGAAPQSTTYGATAYGSTAYGATPESTTYGATPESTAYGAAYGSTTYGGATGASTGYVQPDEAPGRARALPSGSGDGGYSTTYSAPHGDAYSNAQSDSYSGARSDTYGDPAYGYDQATAYAAPDTPAYAEPGYSDYADDGRYDDRYDYEAASPAYDQLAPAEAYDDYDRYDELPRRRDFNPYEDDRPTTVFRSALNAPAYEDEDDRYGTRPRGQVYGSGRHRADLDEEEARPSGRRTAVRGRRQVPLWQELPLLVIIAFSLALVIKTFLLQAFFIPSGSMENTLQKKDRVLVNKVVYQFREPQRGEVIVFRGTDSWAPETELQSPDGFLASASRTVGSLVGLGAPDEKDFIKRVIGVPGDVVQCCDQQGRVLVNGKALDDAPYVFDNNPIDQRAFGPITVPPGRLFMMGDHRGNSQDSRAYIGDEFKGTIPIDQVIGRAFVKVWPVKRWDDLPVPGTFGGVPVARALGPPPEPGRRVPPETPVVGALLLPIALSRRRRRSRR